MQRHRLNISPLVLLLLASLTLPAQTQDVSTDEYVLSLYRRNWAVSIHLPGFLPEKNTAAPDRRYLVARNDTVGMILSVTLEAARPGVSPVECRSIALEQLGKNSPEGPQDLRTFEKEAVAYFSYWLPAQQGPNLVRRHLNAYAAREGVCVAVHTARVLAVNAQDSLQTDILESVRFLDDPPQTSFDLMAEASAHYRRGDLKKSIEPYSRALALEKQARRLDVTLWRVLIDNLGMAYGVTGNLGKAKETFEYGLSQDSGYPLFYYNLACTFGEMNDRKGALVYLRQAFERKDNVIPGERMPDPRTDDSFRRFMKDAEFRSEMQTLAGYLDSPAFSLPGKPWKVQIGLPGFKFEAHNAEKPGLFYAMATNPKTMVNFSVTLRSDARPLADGGCKGFLDRKRKLFDTDVYDVRESTSGSLAVLEYKLQLGEPMRRMATQKNTFACAERDGTLVELHISKMQPERGDDERFTAILSSFRFIEPAPSSPN